MEYKVVDTFQNRLIKLIQISGLSQIEFSKKVDLSRSLINRYIHRGDNPKGDRIVQIANTFSINPLWLMGVDVPINSIVTSKNVTYDIPILEDLSIENIFSIKNYNGVYSNIIDLNTDYQYFYYEDDDKRYLIQSKKKYNNEDTIVILNEKEIETKLYKNISDDIVIGKLISIIYKK